VTDDPKKARRISAAGPRSAGLQLHRLERGERLAVAARLPGYGAPMRSRGLLAGLLILLALAPAHALAASSRSPRQAFRSQDQVAARAIALSRNDVPAGWTLERSPRGASIPLDNGCAKADLHRLTETGTSMARAGLPKHSFRPVQSLVAIFVSSKDAATAHATLSGPAAAACMRRDAGKNATLSDIPFKAKGASVKWTRVALTSGGAHLVIDYVYLRRGRAVSLIAFAGSPRPSTVFETTTVSNIVRRMGTVNL
jgi:hypothetical protein